MQPSATQSDYNFNLKRPMRKGLWSIYA